jgi:hypothetical protein
MLFGMKRWRWLLAPAIMLSLVTGSLVAWAYAHRGYPDAVYYQQETLQIAGGQTPLTFSVARWIDPRHRVLRTTTPAGSWLVTAGRAYGGSSPSGQALTPAQAQAIDQLCRALQHGGQPSLGASWLARANGPVTRVRLAGRSALAFAATAGDDPGYEAFISASGLLQVLAWIDARTRAPLQRQYTYLGGGMITERYVRTSHLAPSTLPADFFDPPGAGQSLWAQVTGWLRDRGPVAGHA